jgi:undecaprenyl-diphosphatase
VAALELVRHGSPTEVEIREEKIEAWLVFVGNGRYGDGFTDLIERDSLDSGVLDVRVVRADRRLARMRAGLSLVGGRLRRSNLIVASETSALTLGVPGRRVDVALDGEVVAMDAPLRFEVEPSALSVLAPRPG